MVVSHLRISERTVQRSACPTCGHAADHVTGFLHVGDVALGAYFAACHRHPDREVQMDVVLGTWGTDDATDHVTFSCRLRRTGAMLVDATIVTTSHKPILGAQLTRDEALAHPRIDDFWDVVDHVSTADPTVGQHLGQTD